MSDHASDLTDLRADFIERLGVLAQAEGGSRNAGRLFGLLAFEGRAMPAAEIADALRIGRSSVGEGARFLESHGMARRVAQKGQRQDSLELTPSVLPALQSWICARRAAVCREFDDIIAALDNASNDLGAATVASLDNIMKALTILGDNTVDIEDEDNMFALVSPGFKGEMMQLPEYASGDYVEVKPLNGPSRVFWRWAGFNWIVHPRLTGSVGSGGTGASEKCYFYT